MNDARPAVLKSPPRASTGITGLDDVLRGGLLAHRVYLVEGAPGAGKTTLALQFLLEGRHLGEAGLYVTLSESEEELRAVAASHHWSLDGIDLFEFASAERALSLDQEQTLLHPWEVELGETMKAILDKVKAVQPKRVVFDSLSEMRLLAQDPLRYRRQILALKQYFTGQDCTVLLLDDLTGGPTDLQLHSICHGVIALERLTMEFGAARRRIEVAKMRGARHREGRHDLRRAHRRHRSISAARRRIRRRGCLAACGAGDAAERRGTARCPARRRPAARNEHSPDRPGRHG